MKIMKKLPKNFVVNNKNCNLFLKTFYCHIHTCFLVEYNSHTYSALLILKQNMVC